MSNELKNMCNSLQFDTNGNVVMRTVAAISSDQFAQLHNDLVGIARLLSNQSQAFVFTQTTPSAVWEIHHSLGYFPIVGIYDSTGTEMTGSVRNVDPNNLTIQFSFPTTGTARLL
jgi:hypothetical protein